MLLAFNYRDRTGRLREPRYKVNSALEMMDRLFRMRLSGGRLESVELKIGREFRSLGWDGVESDGIMRDKPIYSVWIDNTRIEEAEYLEELAAGLWSRMEKIIRYYPGIC